MKLAAFFLAIVFVTTSASSDVFLEDFDQLNGESWIVSSWVAPGNINGNVGSFKSENVSIVDGYLRLALNQRLDETGKIISEGGEISSTVVFGYGTYEFRMRAASTSISPHGEGECVSGGVSASFVYGNDAVTEIDFEFEGQNDIVHLLTWSEGRRQDWSQIGGTDLCEVFHTYAFVWEPNRVTFYRDGIQIGHHQNRVPSTPAPMFFNHWGTHNQWWGGTATADVKRYMFIDYFRFTPLQ